jgi:hypothetical protein
MGRWCVGVGGLEEIVVGGVGGDEEVTRKDRTE